MAEKSTDFSKRVEARMVQLDIKRNIHLAKMVGVKPAAIGKYINEGRIPEAPILLRLAVALQTTMEWLLTGEDQKVTRAKPPSVQSDVGPRNIGEFIERFRDGETEWQIAYKDEISTRVSGVELRVAAIERVVGAVKKKIDGATAVTGHRKRVQKRSD